MALSSLKDRQYCYSSKTGTGCPITSMYGRTPLNKHGGGRTCDRGGYGEGSRADRGKMGGFMLRGVVVIKGIWWR